MSTTTPRWFNEGDIVNADEVGMCTVRIPFSGWFIVENHYGNVRVMQAPGPIPAEDLAEIRQQIQTLRTVHHTLRHEHIPGCVECVILALLKDQGF